MSRRYLTFFILLALALLVAILARHRSTSARPPAPAASRSATPTEGAGEPAADSSNRTEGSGIRNPERVVRTAKARVTAVVTTRGGDAVAGVRVQLVTEEDDADGKRTQEARTDKAGLAVFEPVPVPGKASLEAWDLDAGAGYASTSLKTEGDVRVEVELEPTMTVRGRVTEATTGAPIAGARVRQDRFPRGSTLTDTDGYYMLAGVHRPPKPDPDSEETICLSGEGGLIASARGFQSEHEYPDEGGVTNFKLEKGARVTGRIVDAAGKPVAGASVSASHASPSPPDVQTTGGDGRFMVEDLAGGAVSLLVVRADGSGQLELEFDTPAIGELVDLGDIALAAAGAIAGRVLSAEGNPAPGVTVVLNGSEADRLRLRPGASPETESPEHRVRTDDLGRFAFPGLAPGSFTLVAYGEREETSRAVPLAAGANAEVELRLPPVLRFRVLVVDEAGVPQAGVQIDGSHGGNDRGNGGSSYRDTTDADGVAHFICGTRRPFVEIRSGPPGWRFLRPPPIPVPPGASEVRIVVVAARPTSGVVVDESGAPVGRAEVAAWRGEDLLGSSFSEANGEFSILLAEGLLVELRLTGEVFVPEDHHRETQLLLGSLGGVRPGDTGLRISARRPPRDTRLALRFVGPGNVPAPGCKIQLRGPGIDEDRTLGPDGCVQFEAMPRVPLRLTVFPPDDSGLCWWAGRVTPTGEEQTIALSRELRFTGKAVRSDGKPAGSVKVEVRAGGRVCDWTYAEDDGTFVLSIPEGTQGPFTLFAWGENSDWVGSVEVGKAGEPVKIELTLEK